MAVNSKNKGNTFERKVAKILSERFLDKTGLENAFRRNIDSGSFFGGKNKARVDTYDTDKATFGDLVTPNAFIFTVECKHYKTPPTFASMIKQENKQLDEWIDQAELDSESAGKDWIIIMKFNNVEEMVILKKPFGTLSSLINYKGNVIVRLKDFLAQEDSFFF